MSKIGKPQIQFFGQAGFVFTTSKGTTCAVDLYLSDCVERIDGYKRLCPKMLDPKDACFDYVVATHWHWDHYDVDAIPQMLACDKTHLIAASDCQEQAQGIPQNKKTFIAEGDTLQLNDITISAVFCDHGESAPDAVGLVLQFDQCKVYIAGDTALRIDKAPQIAALGPFSTIIAPINGMFGNMNEQDAVELCSFYHPALFIPCHYWMFAEHHGDPGRLKEFALKAIAEQRILTMCPGEVFEFDA